MSPNSLSPEQAAEILKALADPVRIRIIRLLTNHNLRVKDIVCALDIHQTGTSRHLKTLHQAGLLNRRKIGTQVHYSLARDEVADILEFVTAIAAGRLRESMAPK